MHIPGNTWEKLGDISDVKSDVWSYIRRYILACLEIVGVSVEVTL